MRVSETGARLGSVLPDATYRVEIWRQAGSWADTAGSVGAPLLEWQSRAFEVADADVVEVLGWANDQAGSEQVLTVYVLTDDGLVRIFGIDPTEGPEAA